MYSCGLVLEGGGNRAIYTSGVLDAFMDQGITFPYVIGVSAGSCNAVSYIGKCRGRQHDISIQYSGDKRFMSLENMIKNGEFLNGEWLFGELSYDLSPLDQEAYDRANTTLCVVVTNALTGKAEYMYPKDFHKRGCPILRASCALPGATKVIIAQRINSIMSCDRIVVLDQGRLADMGTHQELLSRSHIYRDVYESQMREGAVDHAAS